MVNELSGNIITFGNGKPIEMQPVIDTVNKYVHELAQDGYFCKEDSCGEYKISSPRINGYVPCEFSLHCPTIPKMLTQFIFGAGLNQVPEEFFNYHAGPKVITRLSCSLDSGLHLDEENAIKKGARVAFMAETLYSRLTEFDDVITDGRGIGLVFDNCRNIFGGDTFRKYLARNKDLECFRESGILNDY